MKIKAKDYFPPVSNSLFIYSGLNSNCPAFTKYIDYTDKNKIQVRFSIDNSDILNIYEYTSDGVKLNYSKANINFNQNFLNLKNKTNDYLIKEPLKCGSNWKLSDGSIRYITNINAKVKTKSNLYKSALEIITIKNSNKFSIDYYVANLGLVKSIYYLDSLGLFYCELEEVMDNMPLSKEIKFYYPDKNLNSIWYCKKNINFYSNDDINTLFAKEFESPYKGLFPLINQNTKINKMYYDFIKHSANIDFSSELLYDMSSDTSYSSLVFSSIYETMKDYFVTDNVSISIDGIDYRQFFVKNDWPSRKHFQSWKISECKFPLTYVVKNGDTLLSIAKKFDIDYKKLAKLNELKNLNSIYPGLILQIYSSGICSIKESETLIDICCNYNVDYNKIIKINNISNLDFLTPGQKIKLF